MAADTFQLIQDFHNTMASNANYTALISRIEQVSSLEAQIKAQALEIGKLKTSRDDALEDFISKHNKHKEDEKKMSAEINSLKGVVEKKDKAVEGMKKEVGKAREQIDQAKKGLEAEKKKTSAANADILELQKSFKKKDADIDILKEAVAKGKNRGSMLESQLEGLRKKHDTLKDDFDCREQRLGELEGLAVKLERIDETAWISRFESVWDAAQTLVESTFKGDLPMEKLNSKRSWQKFMDTKDLDSIPLPHSNSPAAKQMRTAALLAVLARQLDALIFQPNYILGNFDEAHIRSLLVELATRESKKESFCRALLLSYQAIKQVANAADRVEDVVSEVSSFVQQMLTPPQVERFEKGLKDVVEQALGAWRVAQYSQEKFEPMFVLDHPGENTEHCWKALQFANIESITNASSGTTTPLENGSGNDKLLSIFPRMYSIADQEPEPVMPGVALMRHQIVTAANEDEQEQRKTSSPTSGKPTQSLRSRRAMSISANGNGNVNMKKGNDGKAFLSKTGPSNGQGSG